MAFSASFRLGEKGARRLSEAIEEAALGADAIDLAEETSGWMVIAYFSGADRRVRRGLARLAKDLNAPKPAWRRLADTDWVAQSLGSLKPVRAGRFVVHGRHDRQTLRPNDVGIEIEAGEAFGTGHHGTTAGCLIEIDRIVAERRLANALDIGTGSGVLAIAIAKAARVPVVASDIDPSATPVARGYPRLNGVARLVRTITAAGLDKDIFRRGAPYDLVVANILAAPLAALAPSIASLAAKGGSVVLSGLLPTQGRRIIATYRASGLYLARSRVLDGWLTLVMTRPRAAGLRGRRVRLPNGRSPVQQRSHHRGLPAAR
jgi:ribosomal protein L11 methyltransferase